MMGCLIHHAVFHKILEEDMLSPYANGHLLIQRWLELASTILAHQHLKPVIEPF
jgi:hypothetical protein